jgi:hypothetical protein
MALLELLLSLCCSRALANRCREQNDYEIFPARVRV